MKCFINLFLGVILCIYLTGCNRLGASVALTNGRPRITDPTAQSTPPLKEDNEILRRDYDVAEKALNKAVLENDKATIRLGLENPILPIKQKTTEAIAEINDETFVPELIVALQKNQAVMTGGSEIQFLQNKLNTVLIAALEKLTKIKFNVSEKPSAKDIDEVIRTSEEWWKKQQK